MNKKRCVWWLDRLFIVFDCGQEERAGQRFIDRLHEWKFCPHCGRPLRRSA